MGHDRTIGLLMVVIMGGVIMSGACAGPARAADKPVRPGAAASAATDSLGPVQRAPLARPLVKRVGLRQSPHVARSVVQPLPGPLRNGLAAGQRLGGGNGSRSPESGLPDPRDNIDGRARSLEINSGN